jgi:hypothetical protein
MNVHVITQYDRTSLRYLTFRRLNFGLGRGGGEEKKRWCPGSARVILVKVGWKQGESWGSGLLEVPCRRVVEHLGWVLCLGRQHFEKKIKTFGRLRLDKNFEVSFWEVCVESVQFKWILGTHLAFTLKPRKTVAELNVPDVSYKSVRISH